MFKRTPGGLEVNRRNFMFLTGAGAAATFLASCGVGGGTTAGADRALKAVFGQPITDLDPHAANTAVDEASLIAKYLIFDTLVRRNGTSIEPSLASEWKQTEPTTWVFTLREGVKFHDGTPLTAEDVVESVKRIQSVTSAQSPLWKPVVSVEATGPSTVTFKTDGPLGTLPVNLTLLFIVPAKSVSTPGFFTKPVGSGPYTVASFVPSSSLKLKRAESYWGDAGKQADIEMPYIAETSSSITSLSTGEVDLLWPIPADQVKEVEAIGDATVERIPSYVYYFNWFNCSRPPFTDVKVRRAMWHAVDINKIVSTLYGAGAEVMTAPIPSTVFGYAKQEPYEYNPELARKLLSEAGMPDGFSTSLMWFAGTGPSATELAQAMISDWAKIGVKVDAQSIEKAQWLQRLNSLDWDMDLQTNTVTTGDADFTLGRLYTTAANRLGYSNKELDTVLDKAHSIGDQSEREKLYAEACKTIWDEAAGIFPASIVTAYGRRKNLEGFVPVASNQPDLSRISLSTK